MRAQAYLSCRSYRAATVPLVASLAVILSGCWTPPSASVRPDGKPRMIANGIQVERTAGSPRVKEILTVYLAPANRSGTPDAGTRSLSPHAHVLIVDRSYRLLTVQYPNGSRETFKVGLRMPMNGIEAGDSVAIRPVEVTPSRAR